jgi:hypothetical protein
MVMKQRRGKHMELDVSTGWVKRSYVLLAFMMMIGSLSASVFVSNGAISYIGADAIITFLQNGSITVVNQTLYNVSFLVVAGGGAGGAGNSPAGGGGAGAGVAVPSYTLTPGSYAAVVGTGAKRTYTSNGINPGAGAKGTASSFGSSTVTGGGGGAGGDPSGGQATTGGCGGGGSSQSVAGAAGSTYGMAGGKGYASTVSYGGGGGGVTTNGSNFTQPNGGIGIYSSITGSSVCYGGGGGGAAAGAGAIAGGASCGGGLGAVSSSATGGTGSINGSDGTNGTGGGGGGGSGAGYSGGAGGSGIVIVKMDASYAPLPGNATGYLDYCNGTNDSATSITWVGYDILTGNQTAYNINVDLQQVYNNTLLVENFTGTINDSSNFSLCMFPANGSAYAQMTDTLNALNYFPVWVSHEPYTYSNSTKIYSNYFLPFGNFSKLVQIYVVDNTYAPMTGVSVKIQQFNPTTTASILIGTFLVDSFGGTTQGLQPATQLYHFSVLSSNGTLLQDFPNQAIPCSSLDLVCTLVLVVNPMGGVGYTNGTSNGICGWNNATGLLNCTPIGVIPLTTNLLVGMINASTFNATVCNNSETGTNMVSCTLSNSTGNCYNYVYSAVLTNGETPVLDGGMVCVASQTLTNFGGMGLIITFILVAGLAIMGLAFGPSGSCVGAAFGLMIAVAFSFVTGLSWFGAIMAIVGLFIVAWVTR